MQLEQQVVSLGLAKKMKELGFEQDSLFYWWRKDYKNDTTESSAWHIVTGYEASVGLNDNAYSAYTDAELGEWLPNKIIFLGEIYFLIIWKRENGNWVIQYRPNEKHSWLPVKIAKTEVDAKSKMLIYIKEKNLI